MTRKTIVAFGDSLTWGLNPETGERHAEDDRWPAVLQHQLGAAVRVINEGLGGRTTIFDDPTASVDKNGSRALPAVLATHQPIDVVVLMLGTNDLKPAICGTVAGAVNGLERLHDIVQTFAYHKGCGIPELLLVSPPRFSKTAGGDQPRHGRSVEESAKLADAIGGLARRLGCSFFDASAVARSSSVDGVHLDAANTRALGLAIASHLKSETMLDAF